MWFSRNTNYRKDKEGMIERKEKNERGRKKDGALRKYI